MPQTIKLPLGISDFKKLRESKCIWIDKSLIIQELIDDPSEVLLFPRPRRFGKTLNLSMIRYFFDQENKEDNKKLFSGLAIETKQDLYKEHQGKYPVLFFSLKSIKENTFMKAHQALSLTMSLLYGQHSYILEMTSLLKEDESRFRKILTQTASFIELKYSLRDLIRYLYQYHGVRPLLLIDEYDEPVHAAYIYGYLEEMISFMRDFLGEALKDNTYLYKAVVTGILRIAQASIFSGLDNITVYSIFHTQYSQYFGFLEEELQDLHKKTNSPFALQEIKQWYNGYHFGKKEIYNPWSIINCLSRHDHLRPYWINTAEHTLIKKLLIQSNSDVKNQLESLLQRNTTLCAVDENIVLSDLERQPYALWTLFLFSGYLDINEYTIGKDGLIHGMARIPNHEVMTLYIRMVQEWFQKERLTISRYEVFLQSLIKGDMNTFQESLQAYITESGSYFDFNKNTPEQVYHALVLGLVVGLQDQYTIQSNRESGRGRYDVMLLPKEKSALGLVLEFKTTPEGKQLEATAKEALEQIIQKNYAQELQIHGIKKILCIGIAFSQQQVYIDAVFI